MQKMPIKTRKFNACLFFATVKPPLYLTGYGEATNALVKIYAYLVVTSKNITTLTPNPHPLRVSARPNQEGL